MAQFIIKNLPKGFIYLVPPHRIRPFIKRYESHFTSVEYGGVSMSEQNVSKWQTKYSPRSFHLGILRAHEDGDDDDKEWKFRLVLNGVREANLPENQEKIAAQLLLDIESRMNNILALPSTASRNVGDLYLGYSLNTETREAEYSSFIPA